MMLYAHRPPTYWFADDSHGSPCLYWRNPFNDQAEVLGTFNWPTHPKEWDVDGWWAKVTLAVVAALNPKPHPAAVEGDVERCARVLADRVRADLRAGPAYAAGRPGIMSDEMVKALEDVYTALAALAARR